MKKIRYVDLFCGIGGFRIAFEKAAHNCNFEAQCVFSSDIDEDCKKAYHANFNEMPFGDIREVPASQVPDHEVLLAGFPCQPFSIIGNGHGFNDITRGTLFFEISRIVEVKRPKIVILENVKRLTGHDDGRTIRVIKDVLEGYGYYTEYRVLNALDFGLPQKRERVFIIAIQNIDEFSWPEGKIPMIELSKILEPDINVPEKFWASEYIRKRRTTLHKSEVRPSIWHENKAGNITSYPYSCALRASASYNYLLVNGERRLMPREMLRLQGFQDSFKIVCSDEKTRFQAGNSLPIPVAQAVIQQALKSVF